MIVIAFSSPLAGYLIQRWGARKVITMSALLLGLVLVLTSQIKEIWHFYLLWALLGGLSTSFQGLVPWGVVISNWFIKKRGRAIGLAQSGIGLGYFIIIPLTQYIISKAGWRAAFIILGSMMALVLVPLSALLLRNRPETMNLLPDGEAYPEGKEVKQQETKGQEGDGWTFLKSLKTFPFWFLSVSFGAVLLTINIPLGHQIAYLVDVGYKPSMAAFVFGLVGITSVPFRVIWGILCDHIGIARAYTLATIILMASIFTILAIRETSQTWLPYIFALLYGASYGAAPVVISVSSSHFFPGKNFGVVFGFINLIAMALGAPGIWLGGYLFDLTGSYTSAFIVAFLGSAISCLLMWAAYVVKNKNAKIKIKKIEKQRPRYD